jgi:hypothetical protein
LNLTRAFQDYNSGEKREGRKIQKKMTIQKLIPAGMERFFLKPDFM